MRTLLLSLLVSSSLISIAQGTYKAQPDLAGRAVSILNIDGFRFKDLSKNGTLDAYEDWRLPVDKRIDNLIQQMTLPERVGMMLINTLNAEPGGKLSERGVQLIQDEKMTRFIFRNTITQNPRPVTGGGFGGAQITPYEAAQFMNSVQELSESSRLGIPSLFKSNSRNHVEYHARAGINVDAGAFSSWPKESGLAAMRDPELITDFAKTMAQEWNAVGLRGMYGYMADLSTEPRWYRVHETFTEDADLASDIITNLIRNLQGESLNSKSIALTIKHFPGGGPQEGGGDPHYAYGKNQIYPSNNFDYHLRPFQAAIKAGTSSIMAYYGVPVGQKYLPNNVGMAFSKGIVTELLRTRLGFLGYVNSDTGIIGERAWGLEDKSLEEQILIALDAGTDVLSGFNNNQQILDLVKSGKLKESRVDLSVRRLLKEQFELGLFENPYVDPNRASYVVGNASFQRKADLAQRKSIVLLQNKMSLPNAFPASGKDSLKVFAIGMDAKSFVRQGWSKVKAVVPKELKAGELPSVPTGTNIAIIRVTVTNQGSDQRFGGATPDELNFISFTSMAKAKSWKVTPSLEVIQHVMKTVGAEKTIIAIDFRQPYVLDKNSGLLNAGALFATFGVTDAALLDVISGAFKPTGKLPYALANSEEAVIRQAPDAPGYPKEDTLFPFGFGLGY